MKYIIFGAIVALPFTYYYESKLTELREQHQRILDINSSQRTIDEASIRAFEEQLCQYNMQAQRDLKCSEH